MNKVFFSAAICIIILSAVGIIYSVSNPAVDYCAASNPGGLGPAVCVLRESTNWMGIGISTATLVLGLALTIYIAIWEKMRSKYSEKRFITEILLTIAAITLVGLGLFYTIYSLVLVPLGMRNDIAVVMFSCIGLSALVAWYRIRSLFTTHPT